MMRNFTPDVHVCNLDTMQRGTDGPNNMLNGPLGIGIMFSSPMSVAYAFNHRLRVWRQPGQGERLRNSVQRVQQGGSSLMFWGGIMWGRRTKLVVMECAETALRYMNDILRPIVLPYRQNIGEALVFMDDNSHPLRARVVNDFPHCSTRVASMFSRHEPYRSCLG